MSEPLSAEKLTTWAAGSESPIVEFVRTTLGPLFLILVTPPAAIIFWIVCTFEPFNGSLSPLLTAAGWRSVAAHWPWPSPSAAAIVLVFVVLQGILLQWLPGTIFAGPITPTGNRPRYKLNGVPAWLVTHAFFFGCSSGLHLFQAGIVWNHFGEILATLVLFALVFCLFLYFKGRYWPSSEDRSISGNFIWERVQIRLWRSRRNQNWLRVKALFLPNVVIVSHHRSGYQWFRQICDANLPRHVVMPPGARYQHYNVERLPPKHKLDRNGILLVRDGRDVMISLFMSATVDGPDGTRRWRHREASATFSEYLRSDTGAVLNAGEEVIIRMTPVDYWTKFNNDWLANPNIVAVVRYEDLLSDQVGQIRKVKEALGYDADERPPVEINLDFDRHGPKGQNILPGYRRRTEGNWTRIFTEDDQRFFVERAGNALRELGYAHAPALAKERAGGR